MNLLQRSLACAVLLLLALPAAADTAKLPSMWNSTIPCGLSLVGCTGAAADPAGRFTLVIRDLANNPIAYSLIVVDFSECCDDIRLSDLQLCPGVSLDAATRTVRAFTGNDGSVTFCIMGAARGMAPGSGRGAKIYADGVLLTPDYPDVPHLPLSVSAFDLDGAAGGGAMGVGPSDLAVLLGDVFTGYRARSDFDAADAGCTAALTPADLSRWLTVYFDAGSRSNATAIACP